MPNGTQHEGLEAAVAEAARAQHGVFSRAQAIEAGATTARIHHRTSTGRWERVQPGVYRLAGAPVTWRQGLMAACLAWGPGATASHESAAVLWRLPGFEPAEVHLTVPRARKRATTGVTVCRSLLPREDVGVLDSIPVTSPARTILDLAGVAAAEAVEEALDDVLRRRLANVAFIAARARALGRRSGATLVAELLRARSGPAVPMSVFETRLLRLLREAGLPPPALQHRVALGPGRTAHLDFAYPDVRLAIEAEGYAWHAGKRRWERDLTRRNALTALGWRVRHVTWVELVERPERIVADVRSEISPRRDVREPRRARGG